MKCMAKTKQGKRCQNGATRTRLIEGLIYEFCGQHHDMKDVEVYSTELGRPDPSFRVQATRMREERKAQEMVAEQSGGRLMDAWLNRDTNQEEKPMPEFDMNYMFEVVCEKYNYSTTKNHPGDLRIITQAPGIDDPGRLNDVYFGSNYVGRIIDTGDGWFIRLDRSSHAPDMRRLNLKAHSVCMQCGTDFEVGTTGELFDCPEENHTEAFCNGCLERDAEQEMVPGSTDWAMDMAGEVEEQEAKPLYVISATGHRPQSLGGFHGPLAERYRKAIKKFMLAKIEAAIAKYGDEYEIVLVSGGALGVDTWFARLAQHLGLRYVIFAPFADQDAVWPESSKTEYAEIVAGADHDLAVELTNKLGKEYTIEGGRVIICDGPYTAAKMQERNMAMVDVADALLAIFHGGNGGTKNCVTYAQQQGTPIVRGNPQELINR